MMTPLFHAALFALRVDAILIHATLAATVLLALAGAGAFLARRASASARHLLWAVALVCALCLPLLIGNLPHWRVALPNPATHVRPAADNTPLPETVPTQEAAPVTVSSAPPSHVPSTVAPTAVPTPSPATASQPAAAPTAAPARPPAPPIPWTLSALLVWALGFVLMLARLAQGLVTARRLGRDSLLIADGSVAEAAKEAWQTLGIARPVNIRAAAVTVPLTFGARRPVLLVPRDAAYWPEARLRAALLHEMAHVRRRDWLWQIMAHAACALYWFHPLVWYAARCLRAEAEAACDDLVLAAGIPAPDYARHLLDVALNARRSQALTAGAVAMAQGPRVESRLRAVLAAGRRRGAVRAPVAFGLAALALAVALPLAALQIWHQGKPVPAAAHLQLNGDFTLRYAVTITNLQSPQSQYQEYQQLRGDYVSLLRKDPYYQPVPPEYYAPFSYFLEKNDPPTQHLILTVSSHDGQLLWRRQENGGTFALLYNGRNGTQLFSNGEVGRIEPGLEFAEMTDIPLPGVGLPHVPLIKDATLANSWGATQTWQGETIVENEGDGPSQPLYGLGIADAVRADGGQWKVLDMDDGGQRLDFSEHQPFQGQWIAANIRRTDYAEDPAPILPLSVRSQTDFIHYMAAHRTPTRICEYRLLSVSNAPLDMSMAGMHTVSAGALHADQDPQLDDLYVQEALHLRYHLQGWAVTNRTLLRQMAQGQPTAGAAISRVAASLRALPFPLYLGDPRPDHYWDGDPRTAPPGRKPLFAVQVPAPADAALHDFPLARSRQPGNSHVILWASGRITRDTDTGKRSSQQEIVPAFFGADGASNLAGDEPAAADTPAAPKATRADLKIVYLKDVSGSGAAVSAKPFLLTPMPQSGGGQSYVLTDTRSGKEYLEPAASQGAAKEAVNRTIWNRVVENAPVILTGADIEPQTTVRLQPVSTNLGTGQQTTVPGLVVHYTPGGAKKLQTFTAAHHGDVIGIFLDGELLSAPMIEATITGDTGEISLDQGSVAETQNLADRLNGGVHIPPLPAPAFPPSPNATGPQAARDAAFRALWTTNWSLIPPVQVDAQQVTSALDHGADVDTRFRGDRTALMWAAIGDRTDVARLLLDHGADVNAMDISGMTPLMDAVMSTRPDCVQLLLARHADVDAADRIGQTPLILASVVGNVDTVRLLLVHGANVQASCSFAMISTPLLKEHPMPGQWTALRIAEKDHNQAIIAALKAAGETQ